MEESRCVAVSPGIEGSMPTLRVIYYQLAEDLFLQGKAAMYYMGSWALIITYTAFGLPLSVFLMAGFFK